MDKVLEALDEAIAPPMSLDEALEFLELLSSNIESRIAGIQDDIKTATKI